MVPPNNNSGDEVKMANYKADFTPVGQNMANNYHSNDVNHKGNDNKAFENSKNDHVAPTEANAAGVR